MNAMPESPIVDDWEVNGPPWQRSGGFRRDGKPRRGAWLAYLAGAGVTRRAVFAGGGFLVSCLIWPLLLNVGEYAMLGPALLGLLALPATIVLALLGLPLSGTAWFVARRDMTEMERGERDPFNQPQTHDIQQSARKAFYYNLLWFLLATANIGGVVIAVLRIK